MARTVADLSLLFEAISEPTQFDVITSKTSEGTAGEALRGLRVAWYSDDGVSPVTSETLNAVEAAAKALSEAGLEVDAAKPPGISQGSRLWIELFSRAANDQLREFYRGREDEAGPLASFLLRQAHEVPVELEDKVVAAEKLAKAVVERERFREEILRWMKTTPLILAPVGATPAFEHGASRVEVNGQSISVFRAFSYSQTFNVFGLPSVAVPAGRSDEGLPIGVQIVAGPFAERTALAAAGIIETALGGWQRPSQF
jgi:Asp-tRNA(Asn)/Glu-tRNA(Gln) amidotransferase A subunit family amidase